MKKKRNLLTKLSNLAFSSKLSFIISNKVCSCSFLCQHCAPSGLVNCSSCFVVRSVVLESKANYLQEHVFQIPICNCLLAGWRLGGVRENSRGNLHSRGVLNGCWGLWFRVDVKLAKNIFYFSARRREIARTDVKGIRKSWVKSIQIRGCYLWT